MSIAFDSSINLTSTTGTSLTTAFNNVSGNIIYVAVLGDTSADDLTSITYNGVSLTHGTNYKVQVSGDRWVYLYYLIGPATGSNNVVITFGSSHFIGGIAASYSGVLNPSPIDLDGTNTLSGTSINKSLTTTADGDWTIALGYFAGGISTAGANTTLRQRGYSNAFTLFDSNGPITPAGSTTLNINSDTNIGAAMVMAAFKPATISTPGFLAFI